MTDYTDIKEKIEDIQSALSNLDELIRGQYEDVFSEREIDKFTYAELLKDIDAAYYQLQLANDLNDRLSDEFENIFAEKSYAEYLDYVNGN